MVQEKTTPLDAPPEPVKEADDDFAERRRQLKRAERALEGLRAALTDLDLAQKPELAAPLSAIEDELASLRPPEPRKCKEYLRALTRAKKGIMGVSPGDVALYCRCAECSALRAKQGLAQPAGPLEVSEEEAPPEAQPS